MPDPCWGSSCKSFHKISTNIIWVSEERNGTYLAIGFPKEGCSLTIGTGLGNALSKQ